jgi:hypothetical protein
MSSGRLRGIFLSLRCLSGLQNFKFARTPPDAKPVLAVVHLCQSLFIISTLGSHIEIAMFFLFLFQVLKSSKFAIPSSITA